MRTQKKHWIVTITIAALLSLAVQSQALYTNYLDEIEGLLATRYADLTNNPAPTNEEKKEIKAIAKAFKDLSAPSESVAQDYALFLKAALHLGDLAFQSPVSDAGSNVFNAFLFEAQAEIVALGQRVEALNKFVGVKRAASNQVVQAEAALISIRDLSDPKLGLLRAGLVFKKIVLANKLITKGEMHSGFAAENLVGRTLHHVQKDDSGDVSFTNDTEGSETEAGESPEPVSYTYERTGLNTADLVLTTGDGVTTVKLKFTSASGGTFTARHVGGDGSNTEKGTFTLDI